MATGLSGSRGEGWGKERSEQKEEVNTWPLRWEWRRVERNEAHIGQITEAKVRNLGLS